MRRYHHQLRSSSPSLDSSDDNDEEEVETSSESRMKCVSCKEEYGLRRAGTCRECYEEASETEEELKREIDDLKSKVNFLRFWAPPDPIYHQVIRTSSSSSSTNSNVPLFSDIVLVTSNDDESGKLVAHSVPISANRAVLANRSPVFRAMLENEMEESLSGTIKISDVSYDALRAFVTYLYTGEASLDEVMACELLVLAEKYQVKHLKTYCEKFLITRLNWGNSLPNYAFAYQHNANKLLDAALSLIMENMDRLSKQKEYKELVEKDPRLVVEIYEAYLSKQVNTAVRKDPVKCSQPKCSQPMNMF